MVWVSLLGVYFFFDFRVLVSVFGSMTGGFCRVLWVFRCRVCRGDINMDCREIFRKVEGSDILFRVKEKRI